MQFKHFFFFPLFRILVNFFYDLETNPINLGIFLFFFLIEKRKFPGEENRRKIILKKKKSVFVASNSMYINT